MIEGQPHQIPSALATTGETITEQDENLRQALRPNFDLAANATFGRVEKDGQLTITVLKAPGRKGADLRQYERLVQRLRDAPAEITEMMVLACEVQMLEGRGRLDVETLIRLRPRIDQALKGDRRDLQRMTMARRVLCDAPAVESASVPAGV